MRIDNDKYNRDDKAQQEKKKVFEKTKFCPECGERMQYIYGEQFKCPNCGAYALSDFGIVKEYLNQNGPHPAIDISNATGISIEYINKLLREGRIEIPDGSDVYIKCQRCGTDIRYGRFCPECMLKMAKDINTAMYMPEVGEKPTHTTQTGKMHTQKR